MSSPRFWTCCLAVVLVSGCGDDDGVPAADSGSTRMDAGFDAAREDAMGATIFEDGAAGVRDAGPSPMDAGTDAGSAAVDSGTDAAMSSPDGGLAEGELCGGSLGECGPGLSCCYPCGIPGCDNMCLPTCTGSACIGGCPLLP